MTRAAVLLSMSALSLGAATQQTSSSTRGYLTEFPIGDEITVTLADGAVVEGALEEVTATEFALLVERVGRDGRPLRGKLKRRIAFEDVSFIGAVTMLDLEKDYLIVDMGAIVPKLGGRFALEPRLGPIARGARGQSRVELKARLEAEGYALMDVAEAGNDSFPEFLLFGKVAATGRRDADEAGADETMTIDGDTADFSAALNDAARLGYRLRATSLEPHYVPGFLGNGEKTELKAVLVRTTSPSPAEYRVLATVRAATLQREIDENVAAGFIPVAIIWKFLERVAVLERVQPMPAAH